MEWWRIKCPCDDWDDVIPGKNHHENHYNGDGPTDLIQELVEELEKIFIAFKVVPTQAALLKLIKFSHPPSKFTKVEKNKIFKKIQMTWKKIDKQYKDAWKRPAYTEEREAIVDFIISGWKK